MPAPSRMFMGGYTAAAALSQAAREHTIQADKAKQPAQHQCDALCGACCLPDPGKQEPFTARYQQRGKDHT